MVLHMMTAGAGLGICDGGGGQGRLFPSPQKAVGAKRQGLRREAPRRGLEAPEFKRGSRGLSPGKFFESVIKKRILCFRKTII